jgi:DNA repair protein RecN (Recombination protein N)
MLRRIRIKNLAVVEELEWELGRGFNALTGETGAGKSILVDAFLLLLGERADRGLVRTGAEGCSSPVRRLRADAVERDRMIARIGA